MSEVDSRVLTTLSPSDPWGRVCTSTVMPGFAAWNAETTDFAVATVESALSTSQEILTDLPPPELVLPLELAEELPELPPPHAASRAVAAARATRDPRRRAQVEICTVPPRGGGRGRERRTGGTGAARSD